MGTAYVICRLVSERWDHLTIEADAPICAYSDYLQAADALQTLAMSHPNGNHRYYIESVPSDDIDVSAGAVCIRLTKRYGTYLGIGTRLILELDSVGMYGIDGCINMSVPYDRQIDNSLI